MAPGVAGFTLLVVFAQMLIWFLVLADVSVFISAACTVAPIPTIAKPANTLARTFFLPPLFLATSDTTT